MTASTFAMWVVIVIAVAIIIASYRSIWRERQEARRQLHDWLLAHPHHDWRRPDVRQYWMDYWEKQDRKGHRP